MVGWWGGGGGGGGGREGAGFFLVFLIASMLHIRFHDHLPKLHYPLQGLYLQALPIFLV